MRRALSVAVGLALAGAALSVATPAQAAYPGCSGVVIGWHAHGTCTNFAFRLNAECPDGTIVRSALTPARGNADVFCWQNQSEQIRRYWFD
ncbi:hypothetical protein [Longispora urticae]